MQLVKPICDRKQIEAMKKILKATSMRDYCLFTVGINSGLLASVIGCTYKSAMW